MEEIKNDYTGENKKDINDGSVNKQRVKSGSDIIKKIIMSGLIIAVILIYIFIPAVKNSLNRIFTMFTSGDFTEVRDFIKSYGGYAAAVSFMLMLLQSVAAPLPAFVITFANANLFGWWQGAILSWSSAMAGAAMCFYISRILGRDAAERFTSKAGLEQIDTFFEKYGRNTILICRLLPFISFDYVSYAAGLTPMKYLEFALATGIGQIPAIFIYSYFGKILTQRMEYLVIGLLSFFTIGAVVFTLKSIYKTKEKK